MPARKTILVLAAAAPILAIGARAVSERNQLGELADERTVDEPMVDELSQPWELGESASVSVALDGRGASSLAWSADRPIGLESRHELGQGVSLHVGAEALAGAIPNESLASTPDWQAGAAVRAKLDDRWTAGVGAGWRSTASTNGLSAFLDSERSAGAFDRDSQEGEGVVWLRLSASF